MDQETPLSEPKPFRLFAINRLADLEFVVLEYLELALSRNTDLYRRFYFDVGRVGHRWAALLQNLVHDDNTVESLNELVRHIA